jgi:hypothetical protein
MTRSGLLVLLTVVLLLGGGVLGYFFWSDNGPPPAAAPGGPPSFDGASDKLPHTAFVPTLDTPMPEGKSVVWCASFQMAWDRLRDGVVKGPVEVTSADAVCERLNKGGLADEDLPPDGSYAAAGFEGDGIRQAIRDEMARRFPDAPAPDLGTPGGEGGVLAYAYLQAAVNFRQEYYEYPRDFPFPGSAARPGKVHAFGVWPESGKDAAALREQVEVLYADTDPQFDTLTRYVVDPDRFSRTIQVVLARVDRKETLADILGAMEVAIGDRSKTRATSLASAKKLDSTDTLLVPAMHWKVRHSFRELLGPDKSLRVNGKKQPMEAAEETIAFHLDSRGAGVESSARVQTKSEVTRGLHRQFRFDGPFLLYLKRRDGKHPFFVMWVENAELLMPARP